MARRGGFQGGMPGNMNNLMKQAKKMQAQMLEKQEQLENKVYEGTAGGNAVKAKVSGKHELLELTLDPETVDPDDIEMLQDLIVAAVNEAQKLADADSQEMLSGLTGGLGGGLF